jgi:hypothetical protein
VKLSFVVGFGLTQPELANENSFSEVYHRREVRRCLEDDGVESWGVVRVVEFYQGELGFMAERIGWPTGETEVFQGWRI